MNTLITTRRMHTIMGSMNCICFLYFGKIYQMLLNTSSLEYDLLIAIFYYKKNRVNIMHKYQLLGNSVISAQISWSFAILCRVCCFAHNSHNGSGSSHDLQKCVAWTSLLSFEQGMHIIFVSLFVVLLQ